MTCIGDVTWRDKNMSKRKYDYIEEKMREVEAGGKTVRIKEVYGYDSDGRKYFVNLREVVEVYKMLGIERFREVV